MTSWLDGFAKLHSFKMSGPQVLYSGKMLEPPNYLASVEKGELVPQLTLNKFATEEEEWTWWEKLVIFYKMLKMDELTTIPPCGESDQRASRMESTWQSLTAKLQQGERKAFSSLQSKTNGSSFVRFNISDLSTMNMEYPPTYPMVLNDFD